MVEAEVVAPAEAPVESLPPTEIAAAVQEAESVIPEAEPEVRLLLSLRGS